MSDPERPGAEPQPHWPVVSGEHAATDEYGAGQLGTDQFGAPPASPPRRSHLPLYGGLALIAVLILVALALSRWLGLGPTLLDHNRVERDVAGQFEQRYDVAVDVDCPHGMEVVEGRDYDCDAVTADHEKLTLVLTITDEDDVAYTWAID